MSRFLLALTLSVLLLPAAHAQPITIDLSSLDALFEQSPKVEVNLNGALLKMAAMGTEDSDPETAELIEGLRSIKVRVYSLDTALSGLSDRLSAFGNELESEGWQTLVRVRPSEDDSDDVWIYVRDAGSMFDGMAVMAVDNAEGEASFVFIDGPIDPSQVGRLSGRWGGINVSDDADQAEMEAEAAQEAAEQAADDAAERAEEAAERARERAEAQADRARERAEAQAERERERAQEQADRARERAGRTKPN